MALEGTIQKLGLEGGLWALVKDDGSQVELIDPPAELRQPGRRARLVKVRRETAEVSVGMVGDAVEVVSFEWVR
ncbi:MAG: hypothetical protein ACI9KE_002936 [Polyangiales bacterium]|jgi:hypothetical protein